MPYVAHQYSRVGFDSSVEVFSLYYGGATQSIGISSSLSLLGLK